MEEKELQQGPDGEDVHRAWELGLFSGRNERSEFSTQHSTWSNLCFLKIGRINL